MFFKSRKAAEPLPSRRDAAPDTTTETRNTQALDMPEAPLVKQPSLTERMATSAARPAHIATSDVNDAPQTAAPAQLPPEELKKRAAASKQLMAAFGEIVSVIMRAGAWRQRPIADLEGMILPALVSGQFSLAEAQSKSHGAVAPVALVLWARVSPHVDQRLSAAPDAPISLAPAEWTSGDQIWIVEAIGEPAILQPMLQRLTQKEWAGKPVKLRAKGQDGKMHVGALGTKA